MMRIFFSSLFFHFWRENSKKNWLIPASVMIVLLSQYARSIVFFITVFKLCLVSGSYLNKFKTIILLDSCWCLCEFLNWPPSWFLLFKVEEKLSYSYSPESYGRVQRCVTVSYHCVRTLSLFSLDWNEEKRGNFSSSHLRRGKIGIASSPSRLILVLGFSAATKSFHTATDALPNKNKKIREWV